MLNCTYSHNPLALPLGELSPQATERVLQAWAAFALSVFASLRHLSQRERQEGMQRKAILVRISIIKFAREKSRKTEAVFLGALRGFGRKFAIPPFPFSFASVFFWGSKRKCWAAPANL